MDQARDVSMAPVEFQHMPTSEYLDMTMQWTSPPLTWVMSL